MLPAVASSHGGRGCGVLWGLFCKSINSIHDGSTFMAEHPQGPNQLILSIITRGIRISVCQCGGGPDIQTAAPPFPCPSPLQCPPRCCPSHTHSLDFPGSLSAGRTLSVTWAWHRRAHFQRRQGSLLTEARGRRHRNRGPLGKYF